MEGFWNYVKGQAVQWGLEDTQDTTNWIAAKSLLRKTNLRRGATDGHIIYDGAFPDRWLLEFDD